MGRICSGDILENWRSAWQSPAWPPPVSCLQVLVLDAAPCACLLVTWPLYVYFLMTRQKGNHPICRHFLAKMIVSAGLAIVMCIHCIVLPDREDVVYLVVYAAWGTAAFLNMVLVGLERSRDVSQSPPLFVIWLMATVNCALLLTMAISREQYKDDFYEFSITVLRCILTTCLFLLNCIADFHGPHLHSTSPEALASPLSWLTFTWLNPLIRLGFKKPLTQGDMFEMMSEDTSAVVGERFKSCHEGLVPRSPGHDSPERLSFFRCLARTFWWETCLAHSGTVIIAASNLATPLILGWLIEYSSDLGEPAWHGYVYLCALVTVRVVGAVADQVTQYLCNRLAIRVRSAAIGAIFSKSLTMRQTSEQGWSVGEIVNLMSVDSINLELFLVYSYWAWSGFFQLICGALLCYNFSGVSVLAGFGFIVVMLAVNVLTNQKMHTYQEELMAVRDQRLKVVGEVLDGIKVIKLYGWEPLFSDKIINLRQKELKVLLKTAFFGILETFAFTASKFWMTLCILATYVTIQSSHYLEAKKAFLILNYIGIINMAVLSLPLVLKLGVKVRLSVARINGFLQSEDLDENGLQRDSTDSCALRITKGDFKWKKNGETILKDLEIRVMPGELVAVVGTVGSGKSSLLAAALGEMVRVSGSCNISSTVTHVPQEAWIQNLSIQENILFGLDLNKSWFHSVIQACSLGPDLDMLPAREATEIGQKGINLSGGQKQRVSLARAVYSQASIYLLDDPLSAVDSHVGRSIFQNVIGPQGLLAGKTRVLVTHGLQWLPHVDHIYVMEDGRIKEAGTFKSLTASSTGAFAKYVAKFVMTTGRVSIERGPRPALKIDGPANSVTILKSQDDFHEGSDLAQTRENDAQPSSQLIGEEELEEGQVKWGVYFDLFRAFGWNIFAITAAAVLCFHGAFNVFYVMLSVWTDDSKLANFTELPADSSGREDRNTDYLLLLSYCGIAQTAFSLLYSTILQCRHVTTSRVLHEALLHGVMRAPISFFDTTPMGRILNRFSQDIDALDSFVFFFLEICIEHGLFALGILAVIGYSIPELSLLMVVTMVAVYFLQRIYSPSVCRLKRLASTNRSPVFAHFSETVSGLSVIRAACQQNRFRLNNHDKVDRFQGPACLAYAANKWMQFWLDMLGCCLMIVVTLFVIQQREDIKPGLVGLSLSVVVAITTELKTMSQKSSDLESSIVAVERILEYSGICSEAPWYLPGDGDADDKRLLSKKAGCSVSKSALKELSDPCSKDCKDISLYREHLNQRDFPSRDKPSSALRQNVPRQASYGTYSNGGFYGPDAVKADCLPVGELPSINNSESEPLDAALDASWPQAGHIEFRGFSCRYRPNTERVLKEISFTIKGGEKIGVVGRTGAGKSSLVLSLFRLVEADQGNIFIDGVDISTLGLHRLRHSLTILPQDPVMFAGSVRENLDPSGQRSEIELWQALEQAHLKKFVKTMPSQLDALVGDGGENLSMGQRQLVCLARTLLCRTRVLVLDEATAAVDLETDSLVQATIHSAFTDCTVIAIAHRLSSILDYDRVLVLDQGQVVEFAPPRVLMADSSSAFHSMAKEAGLLGQGSQHRQRIGKQNSSAGGNGRVLGC